MDRVRISIIALLLIAMLLTGFVACQQQPPQQADLSEAQVRQLATKYRDEWLIKSTLPERAILARGTIRSVERLSSGWHVVFVTATGHDPDTPEGLHDYYLHVYLKASGELERIERGPDVVS